MARTRTTKKLAQRIDLNYFKRPTALKRAKFWLSAGLPAIALIWIAWHGFARDSRVYSSGRMSEAHAVLEAQCAACHVQTAGAFSAKASDAACLSCHDGPLHHAAQTQTLGCAECHTEHRGRVNLVAAKNQSCAQCHGNLKTSSGSPHYAAHIESFEDGHPEFAALRPLDGMAAHDPGTIKVNHAIHMKPIRRGPNGPNVQLECGDCHKTAVGSAEWKYADAIYTSASTTYSSEDLVFTTKAGALPLPRPTAPSGRERMAPVKFATACAGCHSLAFDKRFTEGVPHDKPEVVHAFLVRKFSEYLAAHPEVLSESRDPGRNLAGKPLAPQVRKLWPGPWLAEHIADAEDLLWRKTCNQCHTMAHVPTKEESARWMPDDYSSKERGLFAFANSAKPNPLQVFRNGESTSTIVIGLATQYLPSIAPSNITVQWMPHAKFDHDAHRGFACASCHEKALSSTETSDVLLPGIATCKACHAPGPEHAESRCFECHTYHDWSKRKEVTPTFTLPALSTGGR